MEYGRLDDTEGEPPAELADHFQGQARLQRLPSPFPEGEGASVFAVHFEPGARTRPHVHPGGQLLLVVAGTGMVGDSSGRRVVQAGDVISAGPGEWHWHGATPTTAMTHVTVQPARPDSVDWDVEERDWVEGYDAG